MAPANALNVLVVCDLAEPPRDQDYSEDLKHEEWESEASVLDALRALGAKARLFGVYDDLDALLAEIRRGSTDVVFNLCEAFSGNRALEPNVAALFELLGVKYTGAGAQALGLCKDKALSKKIVAAEGVRVPKFEVSRRANPLKKLGPFGFPAFVKPLGLESSAGIAKDSFVTNERECLDRAKFVHERLGQDALIEEFIEGRELYVSVLGTEKIEVFPPRELFFESVPEGDPKFATFKAKWDDAYRARWGIRNGPAKSLSADVERDVIAASQKVYRALEVTGYARIDLRLTAQGEPVFLEANPNPSIARDDDFAQSALQAGLTYERLISRILALA